MRAEELEGKWDASLSFGLNTNGWEWELAFGWFPIRNIGVSLGLGMNSEITGIGSFYWDEYYEDYDYGTQRIYFRPAIELRSPAILKWKSKGIEFHLFGSPGAMLSPGASGSKGASWCNLSLRGGILTTISDHLYFKIGYGFTNFYLYDGIYDYEDNRANYTHSGFITFGGTF